VGLRLRHASPDCAPVDTGHSRGSSAEHGIGVEKLDELARYRPKVELDTMRTIKRALDPKNIMNPGKVLRVS
jgi:FAD/FMN-containing dehydrogenase